MSFTNKDISPKSHTTLATTISKLAKEKSIDELTILKQLHHPQCGHIRDAWKKKPKSAEYLLRTKKLLELVTIIENDNSSPDKKIEALQKIGTYGEEGSPTTSAIKEILTQRKDDWEVISHAIDTLGKIGPKAKSSIPELITILQLSKWDFFYGDRPDIEKARSNTIEALSNIGKEAVPALINLFQNTENRDHKEDISKIFIAISIDASKAAPTFQELLVSNNKRDTIMALKTLSVICLPNFQTADVIAEKLIDQDRDIREAAIRSLVTILYNAQTNEMVKRTITDTLTLHAKEENEPSEINISIIEKALKEYNTPQQTETPLPEISNANVNKHQSPNPGRKK